MKKIKLPRKRKKACIKAIGSINYMGIKMVNEILEDKRFPEYKMINGRNKLIKNW